MPPCEPVPDSSESALVVGTAIDTITIPVAERRVIDRGPHMETVLHKRAQDRLDYYIPLADRDDYINGATGFLSPDTSPGLVILQILYAATGVIVWLAGGKDQVRYSVNILVTTNGGKKHLCRFAVVTDESAAPGPTISIDGAQHPDDAIIAGAGPLIAFTPSAPVFSDTVAGQRSPRVAITVSNPGNEGLAMRSITVSGPFSFMSDAANFLDPGQSFTLQLRFEPEAVGLQHGILAIDGNQNASLALSARAI